MSNTQLTSRETWENRVKHDAKAVIASLPMTIPDGNLRRALAQFKTAFLTQKEGSRVYECSRESTAHCIALSAYSGLMPGGPKPDVYLIPRKKELQWQISHRGYIRLARRSAGWNLRALQILKGDTFKQGIDSARGDWFEYEPGYAATGEPEEDWELLRGVFILVTGPKKLIVTDFMTRGQIAQRRKRSRVSETETQWDGATPKSFWRQWPLEMALKTACQYAGSREMFPTDDVSRYVMQEDVEPSGISLATLEPIAEARTPTFTPPVNAPAADTLSPRDLHDLRGELDDVVTEGAVLAEIGNSEWKSFDDVPADGRETLRAAMAKLAAEANP